MILDITVADFDTLLAALIPPLEGSRELVSGDISCDPFPHFLEDAVVQIDSHQLVLHTQKQEKVPGARSSE